MTAAIRHPLERPRTSPSQQPGVLVDIAVLSTDLALFEAVRHAVGERNPVWRARSAEEAVDLLLSGRCGVLLLDLSAIGAPPATLIEQILAQFPDVVLVAAGRRDDEATLAHLISDGRVFRFMHLPASAQRASMFIDAAIRRHVERRVEQAQPLLSRLPQLPFRAGLAKWSFVAVGVLLFIAALSYSYYADRPRTMPGDTDAPAAAAGAALADPVLSRARAALAAGRYEAPTGRNALDLYQAVLLARPDDEEARAGLERTVDAIAAQAELYRRLGRLDEALRLLDRARSAAPEHPAVKKLGGELASPRAAAAAADPTAAPRRRPALNGVDPEARQPVAEDHRREATAATLPLPLPLPSPLPTAMPTPNSMPMSTPLSRPRPTEHAAPIAAPEQRSIDGKAVPSDGAQARPAPGTLAWTSRSYGAPISSGHETAGFSGGSPPQLVPGAKRKLAPLEVSIAAPPVPAVSAPTMSTTDARRAARVPRRIDMVEPQYPAAARAAGTEGWVRVEYTIAADGSVADVAVVNAEPPGIFDAAASQAVRRWRHAPPHGGEDTRQVVQLNFKLD